MDIAAGTEGSSAVGAAKVFLNRQSPVITNTVSGSVCDEGEVLLQAETDFGTIDWYTDATSSTSIGTGPAINPFVNTTTTFYAGSTDGSCHSARVPVIATVNPVPVVSWVYPETICDSGSIVLQAPSNIGTVNWYNTLGGQSLAQGSVFTTPVIDQTTVYYVNATASGCSSDLITMNVVVSHVDASVSQTGSTYTANTSGAAYQWIDCNSNTEMAGMTNQSFTPVANGNYAVIVTAPNSCSDTSDCFAFTGIDASVGENNLSGLTVAPNPTNGKSMLSNVVQGALIKVTDIAGKVMFENSCLTPQ